MKNDKGCSKLKSTELIHKFATDGQLTYERGNHKFTGKQYSCKNILQFFISDIIVNNKTVVFSTTWGSRNEYFDTTKYLVIKLTDYVHTNWWFGDSECNQHGDTFLGYVLAKTFKGLNEDIESHTAALYRCLDTTSYTDIRHNIDYLTDKIKSRLSFIKLLKDYRITYNHLKHEFSNYISCRYYEGWKSRYHWKTLSKSIPINLRSINQIFTKAQLTQLANKELKQRVVNAKMSDAVKAKFKYKTLAELDSTNAELIAFIDNNLILGEIKKDNTNLFNYSKELIDSLKVLQDSVNIPKRLIYKNIDFGNVSYRVRSNANNVQSIVNKYKDATEDIKSKVPIAACIIEALIFKEEYLQKDTRYGSEALLFNKNNSHIVTSMGVNITFNIASILYSFIMFCKRNDVELYTESDNICGIKRFITRDIPFSRYAITKLTKDGIRIGCHNISLAEIELFVGLHNQVKLIDFEILVNDVNIYIATNSDVTQFKQFAIDGMNNIKLIYNVKN